MAKTRHWARNDHQKKSTVFLCVQKKLKQTWNWVMRHLIWSNWNMAMKNAVLQPCGDASMIFGRLIFPFPKPNAEPNWATAWASDLFWGICIQSKSDSASTFSFSFPICSYVTLIFLGHCIWNAGQTQILPHFMFGMKNRNFKYFEKSWSSKMTKPALGQTYMIQI